MPLTIENMAFSRVAGFGLTTISTSDSDVQLLFSAQSYLFSAHQDLPGGFDCLIEIPTISTRRRKRAMTSWAQRIYEMLGTTQL